MQNTQTHRPRHRHFVVLPVLLALVAAGFADVSAELSHVAASVQSVLSGDGDERFSLPSGAYGIVHGGGLSEHEGTFSLDKGSAVIASNGLVRFTQGTVELTAFDGIFHMSHGSNDVTIAAVTTPVTVFSGDTRMVVPAGMQWTFDSGKPIAPLPSGFDAWMRARTPKQVPPSFVERTMNDLSVVRVPEAPLPELASALPYESVTTDELLLPASADKVHAERLEKALGALRSAVESADESLVQEYLESDVLKTALTTERGRSVVAFLLSAVPGDETKIRMALLNALTDEEALWLTASFHPRYRDVAWAGTDPKVSAESQLTRAFLLPFGAFTADSFSDFVFERYQTVLSDMLGTVGDPEIFMEHIIDAHVPLIAKLEEQGYPKRAVRLREILHTLTEAMHPASASLIDAVKTLRTSDALDLSPLPPKREPVAEPKPQVAPKPVEPAVVLPPGEVEARAEKALADAGALFTVRSTVTAIEGNRAHISDILFSSPKEDRSVSFTLDVLTGLVTEIEIDGNTEFPYTPSFEGFTEWIKK